MASDFSISAQGAKEMRDTLNAFARDLGRDAMDAVRFGSYQLTRSLNPRTRKPRAPGAPKVRLATQADMEELSTRIQMPPMWKHSPEAWRGYLRTLGGKAYVAESDRPRDNGFRYNDSWNIEKYDKKELRQRMKYARSGLAKASWRWLGSKAKSKSGAAKLDASGNIAAIVQQRCAVHVSEAEKAITITNRLGYIRAALTSQNAVEEALHAATMSVLGYMEKTLDRKLQKAGLAR